MSRTLAVRLHVISPLHIGCGEVYEPTGFVIDVPRKVMRVFAAGDFLRALKPDLRERFGEICLNQDLLSVYRFIKDNLPAALPCREVPVSSALAAHYERVLRLSTFDTRQVIHNFEMRRTSFLPLSEQPYIPGSGLKGSLRTAWLSRRAGEEKVTNWSRDHRERNAAQQLERHLMPGSFQSDPFRLVKPGDLLPTDNVRTRLAYAVNRSRTDARRESRAQAGPHQILEVIEPGSIFTGQITILDPVPEKGALVRKPVSWEALSDSLIKFFVGKAESERQMLKGLGIDDPVIRRVNAQFQGRLGKTAFPLRLGFHCGADCVTIDGNRRIKIMKGRGRPPDFADAPTTIWLAANQPRPQEASIQEPFGWAVLEVVGQG